jgi:hypothetical protein
MWPTMTGGTMAHESNALVFEEGSPTLANPHGLTADCRCRYNPRLALDFEALLSLLEEAYEKKFGAPADGNDVRYLENIAIQWQGQSIYDISNVNLYRGSADLGFREING